MGTLSVPTPKTSMDTLGALMVACWGRVIHRGSQCRGVLGPWSMPRNGCPPSSGIGPLLTHQWRELYNKNKLSKLLWESRMTANTVWVGRHKQIWEGLAPFPSLTLTPSKCLGLTWFTATCSHSFTPHLPPTPTWSVSPMIQIFPSTFLLSKPPSCMYHFLGALSSPSGSYVIW